MRNAPSWKPNAVSLTLSAYAVPKLILASASGRSPKPIAHLVGCCVQTVRNVIASFDAQVFPAPALAKPLAPWGAAAPASRTAGPRQDSPASRSGPRGRHVQ